ncbi:DUF5683 domain-containing protein [Prevotella sp.]|uniref:DUF5683 domain-containing protein n=1 Tax=Prevotella sp. TaxID=59823 RepID=UPI002A8001BA|nr:DUF5683 domain-containing protein [Prevotella sp.]MDY4643888.1 DUF5683 domain-containing protein [Prevotella sp.]
MNSQGDGKPTTLNKNRTTVKTFLLNILQTLVVAVGMTFIADNAAAQRKVAEPPARIKPANATAADSLNPILAQQDTLRLLDSANKPLLSRNDSLQLRKDSIKIAKKRDWATWRPNPKRAMWLALVLPGAGQIYNRKYWKLPIVYGGFVGCAYALRWNNQMYRDYSQAYLDLMDNDPNTQSYNQFLHLGAKIDDSNKARYQKLFKSRKDTYRRWRDLSVFCLIGVYALSVIDAYVDASLSEFDISKDLSLRVEPTIINNNRERNPLKSNSLGINCSLNF